MSAFGREAGRLPVVEIDWRLWGRWIVFTMLGELAGMVVVATTGALMYSFQPSLGALGAAISAGMLISAGAVEGALLALAQWSVLREYLPEDADRAWVGFTAVGAASAWALGLLGSAAAAEPAPVLLVLSGVVPMGAVLGGLLGLSQWLVLRRYFAPAGWWISCSALAWATALVIAFAGAWGVPDDSPIAASAVLGAVTGVVAGAVVGVITGAALLYLVRHPAET